MIVFMINQRILARMLQASWLMTAFAVLLAVVWFISTITSNQHIELRHHPEIRLYIDEVAQKYHFDKKALSALFKKVRFQPQVIASIKRPYESKTWDVYRHLFITEKRVNDGVIFWRQHRNVLAAASHRYGVPPEIIIAILGIETRYGHYPMPYRAIDALTTLAFNYPRRAPFFKQELTQLLLLSREQHMNPFVFMGSYAGALGIPQFMPSSYRKYAVGFNNPHPDLIHNVDDAIYSIAHYLHVFGWKKGGKIADHSVKPASKQAKRLMLHKQHKKIEEWTTYVNFRTIMHYNTSPQYAMAVYQLAQKIKAKVINNRRALKNSNYSPKY